MTQELADRPCVPCRRGALALTPAEIECGMTSLPGWTLRDEGRRIERRYAFDNFADALAFVVAIGQAAEAADHHPDVGLGWGWAAISWHTHNIGGLHANDLIMAARTDRLCPSQPPSS